MDILFKPLDFTSNGVVLDIEEALHCYRLFNKVNSKNEKRGKIIRNIDNKYGKRK